MKRLHLIFCTILICNLSVFQGHAQISQIGANSASASSGSSFTISKPTGVVLGDIMFISIAYQTSNDSDPSISGWMSIAAGSMGSNADYRAALFYKIVTSTDVAATTFTISLSSGTYTRAQAGIIAFTGVDPTNPFDVTANVNTGSSVSTLTIPGITTSTNNALVVLFGTSYRTSSSTPSTFSGWAATSPTFSEVYDYSSNSYVSVGCATGVKATAGATGNGAFTLSGSAYAGGALLALKPANVTIAGTNSWIGYIYDGTKYDFSTDTYKGYYTENETFYENFGGSAASFPITSNSSTIYTETFSVRYRMNSTKDGLYVVNIGSDDGARLTVDGTQVYSYWYDRSYNVNQNILMNLTGSSSLIFDFYENAGDNIASFQNLTLVLANQLSTNTTQTIYIGGNQGSAISGDAFGTLPSGLSGASYQWYYSTSPTGTQTAISGATGATFTPNTSATPFNTAGTYYLFRYASVTSSNNVSPSSYTATNVSNYATITVANLSVSPTTLTGFGYSAGYGPSSAQSFTVSGTSLAGNVTCTVNNSYYEISTSAGSGYGSSLTLTPASGTLASTTIYVRLKAGLSANNYNSQTITISSTNFTSQTVTCSGSVIQIATQPASIAICSGSSTTLSVASPASNVLYQWQSSTDNVNWTYLSSTFNTSPVFLQSDFSSLPSNTNIYGSAAISNNVLLLTPATNSLYGGFVIQSTPGVNLTSFNANFDYRAYDGSGADGFSLSYGSDIANTQGYGETGEGSGIIVMFDTYDNSGTGTNSQIRVNYNKSQIWSNAVGDFDLRNTNYRNVNIYVDNSGNLSLTIAGTSIIPTSTSTPVAIPGYAAADKSTWKFKFSGRTGGSNDNQSIDNLRIQYGDNPSLTVSPTTTTYYRAIVSSGNCSATSNVATVTVFNSVPSAAGSITGAAAVLPGSTGVSYTVPSIPNATSYVWSYSGTGATINGSGNSITIDFANTATSGNLTVYGKDPCGNGTVSANFPITISTIIYVRQGGKGNQSGASWANAMPTIQQAVELANSFTTKLNVYVAAGTYSNNATYSYTYNSTPVNFLMYDGVNVLGGFIDDGSPSNATATLSNRLTQGASILNGSTTQIALAPKSSSFTTVTTWDGITIQTSCANQYAATIPTKATLQNCKIIANSGNGLYLADGASAYNILIADNSGIGATLAGSSSKLVNATIANNGGVGINSASASAVVTNSILYKNSANLSGTTPKISYSAANLTFTGNQSLYAGYNQTYDTIWKNNNNIALYQRSPNFKDASSGNYELLLMSPCLGKGNVNANTTGIDAKGSARIYLNTIDLGAYEKYDGYTVDGTTINTIRPVAAASLTNINNLEVMVNPGGVLSVGGTPAYLILNDTSATVAAPMIKGATVTATKAYYVRKFNVNLWTAFAIPFNTGISSIEGGTYNSSIIIYQYNTITRANSGAISDVWEGVGSTAALASGKGYMLGFDYGVPNTALAGTIIFPYSNATFSDTSNAFPFTLSDAKNSNTAWTNWGWNLIGNPTAQVVTIDTTQNNVWPLINSTNFVGSSVDIPSSLSGGVYFYNKEGDSYDVIPVVFVNKHGISPYAAFFVKSTTGVTSIQLKQAGSSITGTPYRTKRLSSASPVAAVSTASSNNVSLFQIHAASSNAQTGDTYIIFHPKAHAGIVEVEDSPNMSDTSNGNNIVLNTYATGDNTTGLGINTLPFSGTTMKIPVKISVPQDGSYTLTAPVKDEQKNVYFEDANGTDHDLSSGYTFNAVQSSMTNGTLVFISNSDQTTPTTGISIVQSGNNISITSADTVKRIALYTDSGQLVRRMENPDSGASIPLPSPTGLYLVRVTTDKETVTKKVIAH